MMINRYPIWLLTALFLLTSSPACKKEEPVPEHVLQQRRKEAALKKRREERRRRGAEQAKHRDARVDHYRMWPKEVREAFYALYRSRGQAVPQRAQALARLGLGAADALRAIARSPVQSSKKRALASFMLVDQYMFQVDGLEKLAVDPNLPFAQRAAIEQLVRIGNPRSESALDRVIKKLPTLPLPKLPRPDTPGLHGGHGHGGHGHGEQGDDEPKAMAPPKDLPPEAHPMVRWAKSARTKLRSQRWAYSDEQLTLLDHVLHADTPVKLRLAVTAIKDASLEQGLLRILGSPVARESVQAAAAFKVVEPYKENSKRLRKLTAPSEHQMVRMQAVRTLLEQGKLADKRFVKKLAKKADDPLVPMVERMLRRFGGGK